MLLGNYSGEETKKSIVANFKQYIANLFKKNEPILNNKLNFLLGMNPAGTKMTNDQPAMFNDVFSSIKEVTKMSEEFGVAPTTVLRNYTNYSKIYDDIKLQGQQSDAQKTTSTNEQNNNVIG